jgi:hypothetical protein
MPAKDPARRRATARAWYARHKDHLGADALARRKANRQKRQRTIVTWFAELKASLACRRCGEDHPACLQFHHSDAKQKEISVADAVRRGFGRKRMLAEIAKCEVLCANCHAKHHARERQR